MELHLKGKRYKRALENCECFVVMDGLCVDWCVGLVADNSGTLRVFEERLGKRQKAENTAAEGIEVEVEEEVESDKDEEEKEVDLEPSPVMTAKPTRGKRSCSTTHPITVPTVV